MNALLSEMKRSLAELELGLKGDLTISETMERLMYALANDAVPGKPIDTSRSKARLDIPSSCSELAEFGLSIAQTIGIVAEQSAATCESTIRMDGGSERSEGRMRMTATRPCASRILGRLAFRFVQSAVLLDGGDANDGST